MPQPRPGDLVGAVVVRAEHPLVRLEVRVDLLLVPDVVAGGDDVHAGGQDRVGGRRGQPHPAGDVLAVGGHEVDAARLAQLREQPLDRLAAGLADHVADHQDTAGALRPWRVAVRDVPEARPPDGGGRVYFAYSTARVSRMTVTLIWPG